MYLKDTEFEDENWVQLIRSRVQLRVFVYTLMNFRVP